MKPVMEEEGMKRSREILIMTPCRMKKVVVLL
jgi:hypothetical protein